jgi:Flp pilus assembly pilin Flp
LDTFRNQILEKDYIMTTFIKNFTNDENGAVTVDWVVLTAAVVGLAVAAYGSIQTGASNLTAATDTTLSGFTVGAVALPAE